MKHILEYFFKFPLYKENTQLQMYIHIDAKACEHIILAYFLLRFQLNSSAENGALKQKEYIMTRQNLKL